jgi:hypothetical protein
MSVHDLPAGLTKVPAEATPSAIVASCKSREDTMVARIGGPDVNGAMGDAKKSLHVI